MPVIYLIAKYYEMFAFSPPPPFFVPKNEFTSFLILLIHALTP